MALIVEDGTGKSDADAYVSLADCSAYAEKRGREFPANPSGGAEESAEVSIRNATAYIDAVYRTRFTGSKLNGRAQALEWPRMGAVDASGLAIPSNEVPIEIINATCEAAVIDQASPGSLTPSFERPAKRLKAGSVEIEYDAASASGTQYTTVDLALSGLFGSGSGHNLRAVRA